MKRMARMRRGSMGYYGTVVAASLADSYSSRWECDEWGTSLALPAEDQMLGSLHCATLRSR